MRFLNQERFKLRTLAHKIYHEFAKFSKGIRIISLINREIGNTNKESSRWVKKIITTNTEEYIATIQTLLDIRTPQERIYASCNERSFDKARRVFKYKQLDNEYMSTEQNFNFYRNIYNNWVSALSSPRAQVDKNFLIDYDADDFCGLELELKKIPGVNIVHKYQTENGWHFITTPFNPSLLNYANCEVKKNALLLLHW